MQQRLATAVLGVLLGMPHLAVGQDSQGLGSLANHVKPGASLSVVTTDGQEIRARFQRATASELTLSISDTTTVLPGTKVARVMAHDSSWDGAGIGALVGFLGGTLGTAVVLSGLGARTDGDVVLTAGAIGGGLGLAVGSALDGGHYPIVYNAGSHVTIRPQISSFTPAGVAKAGTRVGVRASIAW